MDWYLDALRKYSEFSGRSRRMEYWMFTLVNIAVIVVLSLLAGFRDGDGFGVLSFALILYVLFAIIPGLAVSVRRLHDTGRSGWWLLISLVPVIGPLVLLVFYFQDSEQGDNEYGPSPKVAAAQRF